MGFTCSSAGKDSACNVGDLGLIPGLGRSPGKGKGYSPQFSGLESSMDCIVESDMTEQISLSLTFTFFPFQFDSNGHNFKLLLLNAFKLYFKHFNSVKYFKIY